MFPLHSLAGRLFRAIIPWYLLSVLIVASLQLGVEFINNARKIATVEVATIYKSYRDSLADALWNEDDKLVGTIAAGMKENPFVTYVEVSDDREQIKSSHGTAPTHPVASDGLFEVYAKVPLVHNTGQSSTPVGTPVLYSDASSLALQTVKTHLEVILENFLIDSIALAFLFFWIIQRGVSRPLAGAARTIAMWKLDDRAIEPIEYPYDDELGVMIGSLNESRRRVAQAATELGMANETLEEEHARLLGIIDSAMDAIITVDESQHIIVFNGAAERMFRCQASDVLGETLERFIPEKVRERHHAHVAKFGRSRVRSRAMGTGLEICGRRSDGEEFPIEASISAVDVAGRRLFTVTLRDITERRRAEEERQRFRSRLEQSQKLEAVGTLAAGIAHDFNNILAAIAGNVELVRQDLDPAHAAQDALLEMRKASRRGRDLVGQILTFSRKHAAEKTATQLGPIVQDSLRMLRSTMPAGIELNCTIEENLPTILGDRVQLGQVTINLCTNAWQAIELVFGRIDVDVRLAHTSAVAAAGARGEATNYVQLTVRDNGVGMDSATLAQIFDPFFTTKPVGQGTGLGLAMVHGIVTDHGGFIDVQSRPGEGTTVTLLLPVTSEPAASLEDASPVQPRGDGSHILYIDDDPALVLLTKRQLERLGYRVSAFESGADALQAFNDDPYLYDLAITDYNMPGESGIEVAKTLLGRRPDLAVVLVSGYITEELNAQASAIGIRAVLFKPDTIEDLSRTIHQLRAEMPRV